MALLKSVEFYWSASVCN